MVALAGLPECLVTSRRTFFRGCLPDDLLQVLVNLDGLCFAGVGGDRGSSSSRESIIISVCSRNRAPKPGTNVGVAGGGVDGVPALARWGKQPWTTFWWYSPRWWLLLRL